ncbi:uncharacterized protein CLUP02_15133 [Colletotrichum lupini]|uniref:Uncharacterized protein n=1 Tax=Colletotrichum lupini TaxID=145971 RepID=A0A9Q8WNQ4_9PEZI|nr:uncharacterized protein CLUP02_15133 [Colletotrichum lupini]UQC89602.1 hypothetical protein CLUP02_15133 [Colletotrichum lupini]
MARRRRPLGKRLFHDDASVTTPAASGRNPRKLGAVRCILRGWTYSKMNGESGFVLRRKMGEGGWFRGRKENLLLALRSSKVQYPNTGCETYTIPYRQVFTDVTNPTPCQLDYPYFKDGSTLAQPTLRLC